MGDSMEREDTTAEPDPRSYEERIADAVEAQVERAGSRIQSRRSGLLVVVEKPPSPMPGQYL